MISATNGATPMLSSLVCNESLQDSELPNLSLFWTIGPGAEAKSIVKEEAALLISSGLARRLDRVYVWARDYHAFATGSEAYSQEDLQGQEWFRQLFLEMSELRSKLLPAPLTVEAFGWWMGHKKAYEFPILEAAHAFCQTAGDAGRHAIAYIHTKGSWNRHPLQDTWRKVMSHFVISRHEDCLRQLGCGYATCGPLLWGQEDVMYAGNFWWARCDYVRRLRSPRPSEADLKSTAGNKGRYVAELWVASGAQGVNATYHKSCWGNPLGRAGPSYPVCVYKMPEATQAC